MKRIIFVAILSLVAFITTTSAQIPDFRKATWGMTKAQVAATELSKPSLVTERGAEAVMRYDSVSLAGLECRVVYIFAQDKLVRAKYVFQKEHSNKNEFVGDFAMVDTFLVGNYDAPSIQRVAWRNDLYKTEPQNYGLAVSVGHLQYSAQWKISRTIVTHALTGNNGALTHEIEYVSVQLESFEDQVTSDREGVI